MFLSALGWMVQWWTARASPSHVFIDHVMEPGDPDLLPREHCTRKAARPHAELLALGNADVLIWDQPHRAIAVVEDLVDRVDTIDPNIGRGIGGSARLRCGGERVIPVVKDALLGVGCVGVAFAASADRRH